jgi:type II secretion system protein G
VFHVHENVGEDLPPETEVEARRGDGLKIVLWVLGILVGLALLAGIAFALLLPKVVERVAQIQGQAEASADMARLMQALEWHKADHGMYPESLDLLLEVRPGGARTYLTRLPIDPWGQAYAYTRMPGAQSYRLSSHGPDRIAATGDDVVGSETR